MVSIKRKKRGEKTYLYAEYSFRPPSGKVKKISKLIKHESEASSKEVQQYFLEKEIAEYQEHALQTFNTGAVLDETQLRKVEQYRVEYKYILRKFTKKQVKDIIDRFAINYTYETNALEGNSLTLKDVALVLHENRLPENKDLREVYETRNTREATALVFDGKVKLTKEGILALHKAVVKDTGVTIGFKKIPNFLLMRGVKTTPPEKVEDEIEQLLAWYSKSKDHPLLVAAKFHARFERIHPFEDGNGRVGRLLLNAMLMDKGYPPLIVRKSARLKYFGALEAADNGYETKLEQFVLGKFKQTFEQFFKVYVQYI